MNHKKQKTMSNKIKVMFVLPSLRAGGAERVMSFLAQHIDASKFEAELCIIGHEKDKVYTIESIPVTFFNISRVSKSLFTFIKHLKSRKPDIVFGSISHINIMLYISSLIYRKPKYIGREANVRSQRKKMNSSTSKISAYLHDKSLSNLDVVVCQSNDMLEDFKVNSKVNTSRFVTINNPITDGFNLKEKNDISQPIKYITVGALHVRKGHKRLLNLLAKVDHDFRYTIIGDGSEAEAIDSQIADLGLTEKVHRVPHTKEVAKYLAEHDVFLNASFVEGFPNVMLESCSVGTPVIAFDAPGGINEILIEGLNGFTVTNESDYIHRLNTLNKSFTLDKNAIRTSVTDRYSKKIILEAYEKLLTNLHKGHQLK